ncbi:formate dehydrogenase family accessory protein FdhD [Microbulbifer agarilyticus]|uniref:Formate dehydrogenase family accessory protein FdhD n=1 Tax=Microbulbifer agarilyticus TaxID=260552 RepID=A0A1Q2M4P8_9GAMM|nr:formate dehydrogenase accessory sulfurtransferase FdhD [Microbulbifer agarilyticus]AQQ67705.1 formate dehydrogenase family accessory protein FdhD [Microbulbifer agarilyticus]
MNNSRRPSAYTFHSVDSAGNGLQCSNQYLAEEKAIAISYNGLSHAVMMASPGALEDFAIGYSISAGVVTGKRQILDIEPRQLDDAICLEITLNQRAFHQFKRSRAHERRTLTGSSACGLCGVEALDQVLSPQSASSSARGYQPLPPAEHLLQLRERLNLAQRHRSISGALHGAIFVDASGNTSICREDVGRHNALDKVIGACMRVDLPLTHGFIAMSSRCGLELVQKATRCGIGTLVTLASPSDIAVRWARKYQLNLIHVPAQAAPRVFSSDAFHSPNNRAVNLLCEASTV